MTSDIGAEPSKSIKALPSPKFHRHAVSVAVSGIGNESVPRAPFYTPSPGSIPSSISDDAVAISEILALARGASTMMVRSRSSFSAFALFNNFNQAHIIQCFFSSLRTPKVFLQMRQARLEVESDSCLMSSFSLISVTAEAVTSGFLTSKSGGRGVVSILR